MSELKVGLTATREMMVDERMTTTHMDGIQVLSTPQLIQQLEETSHYCVAPHLSAGQHTVGTVVCIKHLAATPLGMQFRAEVELIEIDRRRLKFKVSAYDEQEKIAEGEHERFIVDAGRFVEGLKKKANQETGRQVNT